VLNKLTLTIWLRSKINQKGLLTRKGGSRVGHMNC